MPVLLRSRRVFPTQVESSSPVSRVRRLRVVANSAASRAQAASVARDKIDEHLKSISNLDARIDECMVALEAEHKAVEDLLRTHKITEHSNGVLRARIKELVSRQTRTVDAKRFKASVPEKDFWECVSVNVGKAEKVLSERELNDISKIEASKVTGYALEIKEVKKK